MEDRVMKKLTLTALLGITLVIAAVPALGQAAEAGTVPAVEAPAAPLNDLFPAAEILGDAAGNITPTAGGGLGCYFTCDCAGTPLRCCSTLGGGVSCKVTNVIQCPQIYTC